MPEATAAHAAPPAATSGRATASMVLGIIGLAGGFLAVPLAGAVVANVLASLALQHIDASGGRLGGRGQARAGIACATTALVLWTSVFVAVGIAEA